MICADSSYGGGIVLTRILGFWRSREDAHKGGLGPWHKKARAAARTMYESIVFSTHKFTVLEGANDFRFEAWE